jgi:hypothetical protein
VGGLLKALVQAFKRTTERSVLLRLVAIELAFSGASYLCALPVSQALTSTGYSSSELLAKGGVALLETLAETRWTPVESKFGVACLFLGLAAFPLRAYLFYLARSEHSLGLFPALWRVSLALLLAKIGTALLGGLGLALLSAELGLTRAGTTSLPATAAGVFAFLGLARAAEAMIGARAGEGPNERLGSRGFLASGLEVLASALARARLVSVPLLTISLAGLFLRLGVFALFFGPLWGALGSDKPFRLVFLAHLGLLGTLWLELLTAAVVVRLQPSSRLRALTEGPSSSAL